MRRPAVEVGVAVAIPAAVIVGFGIVFAGHGGPLSIDRMTLDWVVTQRSSGWTHVAERISALFGYPGMSVIAVLASVAVWLRDRRATYALAPALATACAMGITEAVKVLVARPRPPDVLRLSMSEHTYSYPSGHAAVASACLLTVAALWWRGRGHRRIAIALAAGWAVAVGAARVYLGVHWLSDVLAGLILGSTVSVVVIGLLVRWGRDAGVAPHPDTGCEVHQPDR